MLVYSGHKVKIDILADQFTGLFGRPSTDHGRELSELFVQLGRKRNTLTRYIRYLS